MTREADDDRQPSAGRVAALVGLLFGLASMGSAAVAIALPVLAEDFALSTGGAAWVISLYALMLAVGTSVYGRVADLVGVRAPLAVGVVLMTAGATVGALAPTYPVLLGARIVQGAGAASVAVLGTAIISARCEGAVRSRALGRVAGVAAAVSCLGPLLGGVVTDLFGWRAAVALPVVAVLAVPPLWRAVPTGGSGARLDVVGAGLVAATAAGLVLLLQSPSTGVAVAGAGAALLAAGVPAVVRHVRRHPEGFLPRVVVTNGTVLRSSLAAASVPAAWFATLIAVPAVLIGRGWSPLMVGVALLPSAATGLLAPRVAGPLLTRIGAGRALAVSAGTTAVALLVAAVGAAAGSATLLVLG
ncbi:MAG TPA: MFS transporter, partial [Mycobacteriales bacterium]|nr:MFS transporter [Mycobacteriales bacterium]